MSDVMELLGSLSIGDFIPWLSWIGRVNGVDKRGDKVAKEMDDILEVVIQEHAGNTNVGENFVDILLGIHNDTTAGVSIGRESIKALLSNVFLGGTDAISTAMEWTMTELLRHPKVMDKPHKEVREILEEKQDITDEDLGKIAVF